MKNKTVWIGGGLIVLATALYTLLVMPSVPARFATHWGIDGKPDGWSDKGPGLLFGMGIQVALLVFMAFLPAISPKKARIEEFQGAWNTVVLSLVVFMGFVHVVILQAAIAPLDVVRTMMVGMMILFFMIGNVLGKAKRNYFMGIRTPWTLESEEVWFHTHRLAARLMVGGAIVGLILLLVGVNPMWTMPLILIAALYPALYSYLLYRKLNLNGGAAAT